MIPLPTLSDSIASIEAALDATDVESRINWMHGLGKREIAALWELCAGRLVPVEYYPGAEGEIVVHDGQNTLLPGFDHFQKHFVLRDGAIQGINVQSWSWVTGPGHFVVRAQTDAPGDEAGSAVFDYTLLPLTVPEGWPALVGNDRGLGKLVYGDMVDRMRRVSSDLTVGKAFKKGKSANQYFMLLRRASS